MRKIEWESKNKDIIHIYIPDTVADNEIFIYNIPDCQSNNGKIVLDEQTRAWIGYRAYTKNESFESSVSRALQEFCDAELKRYRKEVEETLSL